MPSGLLELGFDVAKTEPTLPYFGVSFWNGTRTFSAGESLLVDPVSGRVRVLANASAPTRRVLRRGGGIAEVPARSGVRILRANEIATLVQLSRDAPERFPALRGDFGEPMPADIEFGFRGGKLSILQIRPFVESKLAKQSTYLKSLDARIPPPDQAGRIPLDELR